MGIQPETPSERAAVIDILFAMARLRISEIAALCSIVNAARARYGAHKLRRAICVRVDGDWVECSAADETAQGRCRRPCWQ